MKITSDLRIEDATNMSLTTKTIGHDIRLARMVRNLAVVVIKKLYPSSLTHIQFLLVKDVLQAFMVIENHTLSTI
ncbi:hypothetical protein Hanom_Chr03g00261521 [Helianthus anomalus]